MFRRAGWAGGLIALLAGCYTMRPASGVTPLGTRVAYDITDIGRLALGGAIGPEIGAIEGRLVSSDSSEFTVAVSGVRYLRGGQQAWMGERVVLKSDYVSNKYELHYSNGKTIALSATVIGGVAAFVISRDLFGFGKGEPPGTPPDTGIAFGSRRP